MSILNRCLNYFANHNYNLTLKRNDSIILGILDSSDELFFNESLNFSKLIITLVCILIGWFIYWFLFVPLVWKKVSFILNMIYLNYKGVLINYTYLS